MLGQPFQRPGARHGAVAVSIGLEHRQRLTVRGKRAGQAVVVTQRVEIDHSDQGLAMELLRIEERGGSLPPHDVMK